MLIDRILGASEVWAAWAVAATWQLAVLAVVGWMCERVLRLRQAGARYGLWWFVLVAPLVLAPGRMALERMEAVVRVAPPAVVEQAVTRVRVPVAPVERGVPQAAVGAASVPEVAWWSRVRPVDVLAIAWVMGCLMLVARLVVGHARARRLVGGSRAVTDGEALGALAELCAEAGVRREVGLRVSSSVGTPVLYGVRRPTILLPEDWVETGQETRSCPTVMSEDELRALLAHEVAHVRRGDCLANLIQRIVEIPAFFHPGAWLAGRGITLAREELADGWALARGVEASSYARSLAAAAERAQVRVSVASVGVAEGRSTLLRRVEAIMRGGSLKRMSRPLVVALIGAALVSAGAFAAVQVGEEPRAVAADGSTADLGTLEGEMKNLALAVLMYVQDSKGVFPPTEDIREIRSILGPYLASEEVFTRELRWVMPAGIGVSEIENAAATPFAVVNQDDYVVTAYVDGHTDAWDRQWERSGEEPVKGIVDFTIVDGSGAPIAGAKIRPLEGDSSHLLTTDERGECRDVDVAGGTTCFLVESPDGNVRCIAEVRAQEGRHERKVVLRTAVQMGNTVTFSGRVIDDRGQPVEGASLWVYGFGEMDTIFLSREIGSSGRDGRFAVQIPRVSSGQTGWASGWIDHWGCWILAHKSGYGLGWADRVGASAISDVEVKLTRPVVLRGSVTGAGAGALAGVPMGVTRISLPARGKQAAKTLKISFGFAHRPSYLMTKTNAKGEFAFTDLPADATVSLEVSTCGAGEENYQYTGKDVDDVKVSDERNPLVIELAPKSETYGSLEGQVLLPDGGPAQDILVEASYYEQVPTGGMVHSGRSGTDENGHYRITQLDRGTYSLAIFTRDWAGSQRDAVTVEAGEEAHAPTLRVEKTARVRGRVLDSDTGEPISGATVSARSSQHQISWGQPAARLGMAGTGPDGTFEVICPPGDIEARASKQGCSVPRVVERLRADEGPRFHVSLEGKVPIETRLTLGPGETSGSITLHLQGETLASVAGMVIAPNQGALKKAWVNASFERGQVEYDRDASMGGTGMIHADGSFSLQGLLPGVPYVLKAFAREQELAGWTRVTLATGETREVAIDMYPLIPVTGRVLLPDGRLAVGAQVGGRGVAGLPVKTDGQGRFERKMAMVGRPFVVLGYLNVPEEAGPGEPVERFRGSSKEFEATRQTKAINVGDIVLEVYELGKGD